MRWRNGYSVMLKLSDARRKFPLISGQVLYSEEASFKHRSFSRDTVEEKNTGNKS